MFKGLGIDNVAMEKFKRVLEASGERFINGVFSPRERHYCLQAPNPEQSFAGHFAAKEALVKAIPDLRSWGVDWIDMEIDHSNFGAPRFVCGEKLKKALARINASVIMVSISHTFESAVAVVLVQ